MARRLYTSWFSPFARKVALGLELKGLDYEAVDALAREFRPELKKVNPRAEVPVLIDDGLVIVNSSDILQYLELRYPRPALYPADIGERVAARALERLADHRFDPIVVDCSFWKWAEREDQPPAGLLAAGQRDLDARGSRTWRPSGRSASRSMNRSAATFSPGWKRCASTRCSPPIASAPPPSSRRSRAARTSAAGCSGAETAWNGCCRAASTTGSSARSGRDGPRFRTEWVPAPG
jgi:hypothetical protein